MLSLINPPGIKTFSGLPMDTLNPPLGLACGAGVAKVAPRPGSELFMRLERQGKLELDHDFCSYTRRRSRELTERAQR